MKGIKAGDGRRYIMDLMRLSPRDANFPDSKSHECCVLRPELIKSFYYFQNVQQIYKDQMQKQKEEKIKNESKKEKVSENDQNKES